MAGTTQNPRPTYIPNGNHHHHHHQDRIYTTSSAATLRGCCCCFFLLLFFLALLAIAAVIVIFLVIKPKKPQLDLQTVTVQYLLVDSPASSTGGLAYLSLNITVLFSASNPNKVGIKYAPSNFYVMYEGVPVGMAQFPGFYQPAESRTPLETRLNVERVNVMQTAAVDLVRDATVNDLVQFTVLGDVGARIKVLGVTSPNVQVSVECAIGISPRRQALIYKKCGVGVVV